MKEGRGGGRGAKGREGRGGGRGGKGKRKGREGRGREADDHHPTWH